MKAAIKIYDPHPPCSTCTIWVQGPRQISISLVISFQVLSCVPGIILWVWTHQCKIFWTWIRVEHSLRRNHYFSVTFMWFCIFRWFCVVPKEQWNIIKWNGFCIDQDMKPLRRVIKSASNITGKHVSSISDLEEVRSLHRAQRILDNTHSTHSRFTLLPSVPPDSKQLAASGCETTWFILCTPPLNGFYCFSTFFWCGYSLFVFLYKA